MITEYIGDIFKTDSKLIIQQVNCIGKMGAGIAKTIKEKELSSKSYAKYVNICNKYYDKNALLGKVYLCYGKHFLIANCFAETYPTKYKLDTNYNALEVCLKKVNHFCKTNNIKTVSLPMIGCGLAGGDWNKVFSIIKNVLTFPDIQIYYYTKEDYEKYHKCDSIERENTQEPEL